MSSTDKAVRRAKFEAVWKVVKQELVDHIKEQGMPDDVVDWFERNLEYNTPGGKLNRGMSVVDTAEILKGRTLTDDEYFKAAVLGWGVELLQAFFLVSDDMMDSSITRRGQPCYYRVPRVGSIAINDSFMLEAAIYFLLKKHFRSESYYVDLIELFMETTLQTEIGQLIDLTTAPEDSVDLNKFSLEKHRLIVTYKTAYYSFYLPVALAYWLCGIPAEYTLKGKTVKPFELAKDVLIPLGEYFQVQDDFLDYSGTPEQIGKIGTDILDNKCSWCVNTALARATPEQRKILDENYGRKDKECEARVKALYAELDIAGIYAEYEENVYKKLTGIISDVPEGGEGTVKREVFTSFLSKIYKRQK
ncbi:farnesyl-diphosphate synthase [Cylindrobasidium torrendii FP15055 ss-10]|uniref:(2E,6E)-farnesyl diphosphate synthase n=1 Tax=Cylindrobasidium torrendii FP15055 ss-10 TaxID=1314674 RepID=A0A0D7BTD8_9AGAR|nr:farnesyl-diphosphate synthase [Cylindrobasidium torrendii FP15055 ss-10]